METISARGKSFAAQKPAFLDALKDRWDPVSNPDGVINLGLAENTLMHDEMLGFMNSKVDPPNYRESVLTRPQTQIDADALTYGDGFSGSHRLKAAFCQFLNRTLHPYTALSPSDLLITSGVSNALECCAWALADRGDYILVGRPYFNAFKTTFGTRPGINLIEVSFATTDPFNMAAVSHYEKAYAEAQSNGLRVKALLLCSPHNPLGRCYPEDVLKEYMKFCAKRGLHLISDEIYALSTWMNPRLPAEPAFTSVLSLDIQSIMDPSMVHVVWGLSKDFGATGLRVGCLISPSNMLFLEAAEGISLYNFPSSVADQIASSLFLDESFIEHYVLTNRRRLAKSYAIMTDFLRTHDIPYVESNAAFFIWMDLGAKLKDRGMSDAEIVARLQQEKLYIAPGTIYAAEEAGWFRGVFAHPPSILLEAQGRMVRALDLTKTSRPYHIAPSLDAFNVTAERYLSQHGGFAGIFGAAIIMHQNRILLLQRAANDDECPNLWEVSGGGAQGDETPVDCAVRELREETGLIASAVTAIIDECEWTEEEDTTRKWKVFTFFVKVDSDSHCAAALEVQLDQKEHRAYLWATESDIKEGSCAGIPLHWTAPSQKQAVLAAFEMNCSRPLSRRSSLSGSFRTRSVSDGL
ncbi:pyridoxal phosphate-dependent transferase [Aspergillus pseudoustus]|uniref:Pyridoxal phosphate-dependent transferase n=1 Tax=Aspergillus pseudoustus TaxID=1810923 RepID=A0ABR4JGK0_9EURO